MTAAAERCLRCVPHDEDTGGFFVATFRKISNHNDTDNIRMESSVTAAATPAVVDIGILVGETVATDDSAVTAIGGKRALEPLDEFAVPVTTAATLSSSSSSSAVVDESACSTDTGRVQPGVGARMSTKGLVEFKPWDAESFLKMKEYYGLADYLTNDMFMIREDFQYINKQVSVSAKSVYFIPPVIRQLMVSDKDNRLKIVSAGSKMFERKVDKDTQHVEYRLLQVRICLPFHLACHIVLSWAVIYLFIYLYFICLFVCCFLCCTL